MDTAAHTANPGITEMDTEAVLATASQNKLLILLLAMLGAIAAYAASFLLTPVYRSEILLMNSPVERQSGNLLSSLGSYGGLAALAGFGGLGDDNTQEAIAVLRSRLLIDQFVTDKHLLPVLFYKKWDAAKNEWKATDAEKIPTLWDAYELFDKSIRKVELDRRTGLITLSIDWKSKQDAAAWATELVKRANALLRQKAIDRSAKNLTYLNEQLQKSSEVEVRQAIFRLIEAELKRDMIARVNEDYAFKVVDPAYIPKKKISPKRALFAIFGLLLGASAALALLHRRRMTSAA